MFDASHYTEIKHSIIRNLKEYEGSGAEAVEKGLKGAKDSAIRSFLNLGKPITQASRRIPQFDQLSEPKKEEFLSKIKIENKNLVVMCGGGKDSEFVLSVARAVQLMILDEYGETFKLRVAIGRQPGMIDVYDNLEHCFDALGLKNDPLVDIFFIDGKETYPYDKDRPIPDGVTKLHRDNVLMNGHLYSGAGRRTFCDDCNKNLGGWIATALSYRGPNGDQGGADLYMTGDSRKELKAQIGTAVPEMARKLGITLTEDIKHTPVQRAFALLGQLGDEHSRLIHGEDGVAARSIDVSKIPQQSRFLSIFPKFGYESKKRLPYLEKFLGFGFDSLMFSFSESDCGNPALMCHLYGLMAEHVHGAEGATYADGVRMAMEAAIGVMKDKGFAPELIQKMRDRYKDDEEIQKVRNQVEEYAKRAYGLEPEHLVAMVYSPFTEHGRNLHRYLEYLDKQPEHTETKTWVASEEAIKAILLSPAEVTSDDEKLLVGRLEKQTGLSLPQMRRLNGMVLQIDNFDAKHEGDLSKIMAEPNLYTFETKLHIPAPSPVITPDGAVLHQLGRNITQTTHIR